MTATYHWLAHLWMWALGVMLLWVFIEELVGEPVRTKRLRSILLIGLWPLSLPSLFAYGVARGAYRRFTE